MVAEITYSVLENVHKLININSFYCHVTIYLEFSGILFERPTQVVHNV